MSSKSENPKWLSIWIQPRLTMRRILETEPQFMVLPLAFLYGIVAGISWAGFFWSRFPENQNYRRPLFIIALLIIGAIYGIINLYVGAFLYKIVGSWLRGKGTFREVKSAVGWSFYPFIISAIFGILSFTFYQHPFIAFIFSLLNLASLIWAYVVFFQVLGEAHQFSAWRSLGTLLISLVIIFIVFALIALIIPLLKPIFVSFML